MSKAIQTEAHLTGFSTRVDGGLSVRLVTPELKPEEKTAFFELQGQLVEMLIFVKGEREADVVKVTKEIDEKTPSQRLRGALFRLWEHEGKKGEFSAFYAAKMEQYIDHVKNKLPKQ